MYEAIGGTAVADHDKALNTAKTATIGSACALENGTRVDAIFYGAGPNGKTSRSTSRSACAEAYAHKQSFKETIELREGDKNELYKAECKKAGVLFYPFVLGAHGGFGEEAKVVWDLFKKRAGKVARQDWRHSWTVYVVFFETGCS